MKRLFAAVPVSEHVKEKIKPFYKQLAETGAYLKFVSLENIHFTLKFLGDVEESKIAEIKEKLQAIALQQKKFPLRLKCISVFPSLEHIRSIWISVLDSPLTPLMKKINEELSYIRKEKREEVPHSTIARVKSGRNKKQLQEVLEEWRDKGFGEMVVDKIILYESELTSEGPVYTELGLFELS